MSTQHRARRAAAVAAGLVLLWGTPTAAVATGDHGQPSAHEETPAADPHAGHDMPEDDADGHGDHEAPAETDGHGDHESPAETDGHSDHESPAEPEQHGDHGTGTGTGTVSDGTRTLVLSGFGAVNAGVLVVAALIRRRDRRTAAATGRRTRSRR